MTRLDGSARVSSRFGWRCGRSAVGGEWEEARRQKVREDKWMGCQRVGSAQRAEQGLLRVGSATNSLTTPNSVPTT